MASSLFGRPQNSPQQTQSNPFALVMQAMKRGATPAQFVAQMAAQNPVIAQVQSVIRGKTPEQLNATLNEMCRQQGTTPEALARQLGLPL